ncbi:MAG: sigma 54-interacting transcriptional regulator [Planctomycetes bacterium]|nr:sigma 54-interacting transcriptional regulator [Planctomycetota bacterium]MCB9825689.1 sigma 54-interacting transcriptional regulator [Planctomycetota bacterium]MCB9901327.1 sigma 54-interacting transcriptional regulator [Planctomycetota bacterium]
MSELRLFVRGPQGEERVYDITQEEVLVGRDPEIAVPVGDRTLSRHHCRIYRGADGWRITDLGSRNGTFLNGRAILDELLASGDRVEIGETRMSAVITGDGIEALVPDLDAMATRATPRDARGRDAHHERQREIRALRHLIELNEKINALEDEDTLLDGVLDAAIELTRAGRGLLLLEAGDHFVVRRARLPQQRDLADPEGSFSVSVAASVVREGKSVLSEDARMDARFDGTASVAALELRSLVCVPLKTSQGIIGAIYLDNRYEHGTFDGWDVRVLEGFAGLAGIALQNARQRREMGQRRREAVRQARRIERLNDRLRKALRIRTNALRRAREDLAKQTDELGLRYSYEQIVGRSPAMRAVLRLVDRVTDLDIPVLIQGESGTGKELIARAVHFNGPRRRARLVSESCAAIPPTLMESEFFGYMRGAFTGANRDHAGLFEQADAGTLFLDEVGEMPLEIQGKLLRVLEEREVRRLGSKKVRPVDVRLVSATNRVLQDRIRSGAFREDLYYRLAGLVIELPALRERKEDIPALVAHFLQEAVGAEGRAPRMDPAALELLTAYEWPGNVRELRNEVQRLVALQVGGTVLPEHLSQRVLDYRAPALDGPTPGGLKALVEDLERRVLRATLLRHGWNKSRAAAELGLSRLGLRKKLERYGMDVEQPPEA